MRIPQDATIDETKFTGYLLVQRPWDDKSDYLRHAGFELKNWQELRAAIRRLADAVDAVETARTNTARSIASKECSKVRPGICQSCVSG
jgi:hypothetical protein